MLDHENDSYNGVIIDEKGLPEDKDSFKKALESSLEVWRLEGRKGVWLKVINCEKYDVVYVFVFHKTGSEQHMTEVRGLFFKNIQCLSKWFATES